MKRTYRHYGIVKDGIKIYANPDLQKQSVMELEGKEFEEVIQKKKKSASKGQYGYLFGGIIPEALEYETFGGWTEKELKEFFEDRFLSYFYQKEFKLPNGIVQVKTINCKGSFKGLDSDQMQQVIEEIIRFLAEEAGIIVKTPEEYHHGKYQTVPASGRSEQ